jgi:RNA polymerase sigma factor (sigma-70 family)
MGQEPLSLVMQEIRRLAGAGQGGSGSDATLLQRFVGLNDEAAFELLLRRHGPVVWGVCHRILDRDHDAEDVFQATFFVLAQKAASIRKPESLASWLYGVACRLARKYQAEQARRRAHEKSIVSTTLADPVHEVAARETAQIVVEEVERLPEHYRAPVVLCYLVGRTHEVAAVELGCPVGTLKARLSRALKLLGKRLARRGVALPAGLTVAVFAESEAVAIAPAGLLLATAAAAVGFRSGSATSSTSAATRLARTAVAPLMNRLRTTVLLAAGLLVAAGGLVAQQQWNTSPPEEGAELPFVEPPQPPPLPIPLPEPMIEPALAGLPPGAGVRLGSSAFLHGIAPGPLAFSANGQLLLTGDQTGSIHLWRVDTGQELRQFPWPGRAGRREFVSLVLSPDGQRVAARYSSDERVHLWAVATGKEIAAFAPDPGRSAIAYLPSGELLARCSRTPAHASDTLYGLWDPAGKLLREVMPGTQEPFVLSGDGKVVATLEGPCWTRPPVTQSPSPDLRQLAGSQRPSTIHVWDVADGRRLANLVYPEGICVDQFALSPQGRAVFTYDNNGRIHIRDVRLGRERLGFPIDGWTCTCSRDGRMLAVCHMRLNARVVVWDLLERKILRILESAARAGLAFSPDGRTLATGGTDHRIHLWDTSSWTERFPPAEHDDVRSLAFAPDDGHLLSVGLDHSGDTMNRVTWDLARTDAVSRSAIKRHRYWGSTADGDVLVLANGTGTMRLEDPFGGRRPRTLADTAGPWTTEFMNHGRTLIRTAGGNLYLGDTGTGDWRGPVSLGLRQEWPDRHDLIASAVAAPGDTLDVLVWRTGSGFRHLLFQADSLKQLIERNATEKPLGPGQAVFSPDGRLWAPCETSFEGVWETCTGKCVFSKELRDPPFHRLWFSPNSRLVLIAEGWDRAFLSIRDLIQGTVIRRLGPLDGPVRSVAFSRDGRKLATGFDNGAILVWDLASLGISVKGPTYRVSTDQLEQWWGALGEANVAGFRASWMMVDSAEQALPLLAERLRPVVHADPAIVREFIARLHGGTTAERDLAWAKLQRLGSEAEPEIRRTLAAGVSPEMRDRLEASLMALPGQVHFPPPGERLRRLRAVAVLERIGTPAACQILEKLASGLQGAEQTVQAQAALKRLQTGDAH